MPGTEKDQQALSSQKEQRKIVLTFITTNIGDFFREHPDVFFKEFKRVSKEIEKIKDRQKTSTLFSIQQQIAEQKKEINMTLIDNENNLFERIFKYNRHKTTTRTSSKLSVSDHITIADTFFAQKKLSSILNLTNDIDDEENLDDLIKKLKYIQNQMDKVIRLINKHSESADKQLIEDIKAFNKRLAEFAESIKKKKLLSRDQKIQNKIPLDQFYKQLQRLICLNLNKSVYLHILSLLNKPTFNSLLESETINAFIYYFSKYYQENPAALHHLITENQTTETDNNLSNTAAPKPIKDTSGLVRAYAVQQIFLNEKLKPIPEIKSDATKTTRWQFYSTTRVSANTIDIGKDDNLEAWKSISTVGLFLFGHFYIPGTKVKRSEKTEKVDAAVNSYVKALPKNKQKLTPAKQQELKRLLTNISNTIKAWNKDHESKQQSSERKVHMQRLETTVMEKLADKSLRTPINPSLSSSR